MSDDDENGNSTPHTDGQRNERNDRGRIERMGYINGIPPTPRYSLLLELITRMLGKTVPLFEHTLTSLHRSNAFLLRPRILPRNNGKPPLIQYARRIAGTDRKRSRSVLGGSGADWVEEDPPDPPGQGIGEGTDDEEDEALWEEWRIAYAKWVEKRRVVLPDVPSRGCAEWVEGREKRLKEGEKVSLTGRNIQVFVKLGRVELVRQLSCFLDVRPLMDGVPCVWGPVYYRLRKIRSSKGVSGLPKALLRIGSLLGGYLCEVSFFSDGSDEGTHSASVVLDSDNVSEGWLDFRMAVTRPALTVADPDSAGMAYWGKKRSMRFTTFSILPWLITPSGAPH